jgi:hypothetical protein
MPPPVIPFPVPHHLRIRRPHPSKQPNFVSEIQKRFLLLYTLSIEILDIIRYSMAALDCGFGRRGELRNEAPADSYQQAFLSMENSRFATRTFVREEALSLALNVF